MLSCSLEFIPNHAKAQKPYTKGIFFVAGLSFHRTCRPLIQRLCCNGKAELDICLNLSRVHFSVKGTEFHCALLKHTVQIKTAVAAGMIMLMAAVTAAIPNSSKFIQ